MPLGEATLALILTLGLASLRNTTQPPASTPNPRINLSRGEGERIRILTLGLAALCNTTQPPAPTPNPRTDLSRGEGERIRMSRLETAICTLVNMATAWLNYTVWSRAREGQPSQSGVQRFAYYATACGAAGSALTFGGLYWLRRLERRRALASMLPAVSADGNQRRTRRLMASFFSVAVRHRNFWCFAVMSVLMEMQATFNEQVHPCALLI